MGKLIRLELFNFKSYKGHHNILFNDSYFTSIIGPNGSGKSNSMDAISFVLGIKSSQLRSAHLKELVYRGRVMKTAKIQEDGSVAAPETNGHANGYQNGDDESSRASRGDPKSAWVMAVYEDDAGDEQRWKRTITSQGASEYRINDRVVTSQQYNDALEAENILIKARNFLVFQGDVEAIASQSPQDLTRLIEQISGSLEYKVEYEKLKAAEEQAAENQSFMLNRRRGINSEIKQYQEQKREADLYQKKVAERDKAIVTQILWKLYHFQRVMEESSQQIHEHQENLKEFRRSMDTFEKQLEAARKEQAAVGREVGKIEKAIKNKQKAITDGETALIPIQEKVKEGSRNVEALRARLKTVEKERDDQLTDIEKAKAELTKVEKDQEKFERQWRETLKKQGKELSEADRKEYNELRGKVIAQSADNQSQLAGLARQLKGDELAVKSLKGQVDACRTSVAKLSSELESIQKQRDAAQETEAKIAAEIDAKKNEHNQVKSERIRIHQSRTELEGKLRDVCRRLEEADAGRRQSDREKQTKEKVSTLKRLYPGVKGRVGDLCRPKQKKYEEAVIIVLGHDFDSVVVDTHVQAMSCVDYLKKKRLPPMTFIPLDNIKAHQPNSSVKGKRGVQLAIDTIDFEPAVERAMAFVCGSSVVCDNFDIAKELCYNERAGVKAVTLDGKVIHRGGLMTGGRVADNKGNKRRFEDQDLENYQRLAEKFRGDLEKLPRVDTRRQTEEVLRAELEELESRLVKTRDELQACKRNHASKSKELASAQKELRGIEPRFNQQAAELEATRQSIAEYQAAIAQVEDKMFAGFCKRLGYSDIRAYEAQQGSLEQDATEKRTQFEIQKQKLNNYLKWEMSKQQGIEERVRHLGSQVRNLRRDIEGYRKEEAAVEEQLGELRDEQTALEESLDEVKAEHLEKSAKVQEVRAEVQKRSRDIEGRLKAINVLETEVQKNSAHKFALLRRCKLEQIQVPLVQGSLDDLPNEDNLLGNNNEDAMDVDEEEGEDAAAVAAAMEDYGIEIDYDDLPDDLKNSDDEAIEDQLEKKVADLNSELEKFSPNMRANERLETVELRLKQTEKEFQESRSALKHAHDSFKEIKAKRFERFNKAFSHIQERITPVYKELTRTDAYPLGGQAYLDIEEDTDTPYLSGIKYHAMPPLKRFRDMEHLSGGEKTMAAMALLFAIHSYQPSPFFVLDEIDAALDNANVDKIKKYIRDHAGPGMQFIVISLKPGLFQDSECLVGVYRDQDTNTSRTVTLDLRGYQ